MDYLEQLEARTSDAELELGPLVLGKPYLLLARDVASGDHDRVFFAHDGSPRQLTLAHGLRLRGTLDLAPALSRSVAGFTMQARVNQEAGKPFSAGFLLDRGARKVLLRENGEVALLEHVEGRDRALASVVLDSRPGPGRWFDLAWAQEGDLIVVFYESRPLFARRVAAPPPSALALTADAAANFRGTLLRRP